MTYQWQTASFSGLSQQQLYAAMRLRQQVFALEQAILYLDLDNLDQQSVHMLCWEDTRLLAYQRCLPPGLSYPGESAMGRIVVCREARGRQLGRELVQRGISHNLQQWPQHNIRINAQAYLQKFYAELGFVVDGEEYDEDGIPHIQMLYHQSTAFQ